MATIDPTVFNRHRLTIDDLTDAAHRLVLQLDSEIMSRPVQRGTTFNGTAI